jgi:predicted DNA-binding transcriptional regulator AlpA
MKLDPDDALLTDVQLAAHLGIGRSTLQKMRLSGSGPVYIKIGRKVTRYRMSDVQVWLAARERKSTADPGPKARGPKRAQRVTHKGRHEQTLNAG